MTQDIKIAYAPVKVSKNIKQKFGSIYNLQYIHTENLRQNLRPKISCNNFFHNDVKKVDFMKQPSHELRSNLKLLIFKMKFYLTDRWEGQVYPKIRAHHFPLLICHTLQ